VHHVIFDKFIYQKITLSNRYRR